MKSFNIIQHVDNTHTGHYSKLTKVMQKKYNSPRRTNALFNVRQCKLKNNHYFETSHQCPQYLNENV